MPWTDEVVEELRKLWAEGLTTSEIAKKLGVSKNSIVGKVHRLGLSGRPSPIKRKVELAKKEKKAKTEETVVSKKADAGEIPSEKVTKPIKAVKAEKAETKKETTKKALPVEEPIETFFSIQPTLHTKSKDGVVRLVDLDSHTCRWPVGDPKDEKFHFCGKKVRIGQTYCEEHSEAAYVRQTKK
ncbi:MAG: GcrA family cell cycle regulator [Alphaproteobacteria bacterium]|nr:GcrA family cell cycle regulator [Alphaproteobacteria bacterium]